MSLLPALVIAGALTFATRLSFVLLLARVQVPPLLVHALRFVPPAVLSAIVASEIFVRDGAPDLSPANPRLLAGAAAAVVAWRTRNVLLTIAVGMAALWVLQWAR